MSSERRVSRPTKAKILLVDDEPRILRSLKTALSSKYQIYTADGGSRAKELLGTYPDISVVLSDERMPELLGHDLLYWVKGHYPNCQRILMTGYSDLNAIQSSINDAEIYRYLTKPWNIAQVISTLDEAIQLNIKDRTKDSGNFEKSLDSSDCFIVALDFNSKDRKTYEQTGKAICQNMLVTDSVDELFIVVGRENSIGVAFIDAAVGHAEALDIIQELRNVRPEVVVVVVTSAADGLGAIKMLNEGQIYKYLVKPLTATRLMPMLAASVEKHNLSQHKIKTAQVRTDTAANNVEFLLRKLASFFEWGQKY